MRPSSPGPLVSSVGPQARAEPETSKRRETAVCALNRGSPRGNQRSAPPETWNRPADLGTPQSAALANRMRTEGLQAHPNSGHGRLGGNLPCRSRGVSQDAETCSLSSIPVGTVGTVGTVGNVGLYTWTCRVQSVLEWGPSFDCNSSTHKFQSVAIS